MQFEKETLRSTDNRETNSHTPVTHTTVSSVSSPPILPVHEVVSCTLIAEPTSVLPGLDVLLQVLLGSA